MTKSKFGFAFAQEGSNRMKRASYREGIAFIALNDDPGDANALDEKWVRGYVTVVLMSELFGVETDRVARDVVRYRRKHP